MTRPFLTLALVVAAFSTRCGGPEEAPVALRIVREDPTDSPIAGIDAALLARFNEGDALFEAVFRGTQGLGPLYIRHACASCHADDAKGPGSVTKMVIVEADGVTPRSDQSMFGYGHTVRPQREAGATAGVVAPALEGLKTSKRFGPAVFGRGYLEAVDDREIERMEREQSARDDGISGRVNRVTYHSEPNPEPFMESFAKGQANLIGRFGVKARIPTIDDFSADAYQGDMGITSPMRPTELPNPDALEDDGKPGIDIGADVVNATADYVRLLAIPRREGLEPAGAALFDAVRCAVCHAPALATRADHPVPQLAGVAAPIYSDLLIHDMGDALADGIVEESAGPREWRTAPLIGLRHLRNYMHDGRADTVEEAIRAHAGDGSEANDSVARFNALDDGDRALLLDFVSRL